MASSHYLANGLLDLVLGATPFTSPATVYGGRLTQAPSRDGTGVVEPSVGGYARIAVTNNATNFPAAALGTKAIAVEHAGAAATLSQGTHTHFAWFDASTAGNLLSFVALPTPEAIAIADVFTLRAGNYSLRLRGVTTPALSILSTYLANELADHYLGAAAYSPPANLHAFLSYTQPAADGSNITEPSGFGYARKSVANNSSNFGPAASGQKDNDVEIAFVAASGGSWGTPRYWGFFDAGSGGNFLMAAQLTQLRTINAGSVYRVPIGQMIAGLV